MRRDATNASGAKFLQTVHQFQIRGVRFAVNWCRWPSLASSTTGNCKIVPMELRTARRRNGLLEVSPTINACTPKATQLRTSAPRFSALVSASTATSSRGFGFIGQNVVEHGGRWDFSDGEYTLIHRKADEGFEQFFVREINGEFFRARFKQRAKRLQVFFGQQNRDDLKTAFEQPAHDLFALGHEDALPFMLQRPTHGAIRREFRQVERGDFLNPQISHVCASLSRGRAGRFP